MALKETFYISHGSPTLAIDETIPAWKFLTSWKEVFPERPSAILVISGHWDTSVPTVNVVNHNETIHDFGGFPRSMYKLKYPAPGAPKLAKRVKELIEASGLSRVDEDKKRGLDHGTWVPLMLMYPEADIPVCQLSVSSNRNGTYHYNLGKAIAPLKDEGVLIIGSGSATHNMRAIGPRESPPPPWALAFDSWLKESLVEGRYEDINHYEEKAPYAKVAHPWPDHFFPLHVAMGAAGENSKAKVIHESWDSEMESSIFHVEKKIVVKYKECLKNHAATIGGNAIDGCGEFMPNGENDTLEALKCCACNCHRNFHRKEIESDFQHYANLSLIPDHNINAPFLAHLSPNNKSGSTSPSDQSYHEKDCIKDVENRTEMMIVKKRSRTKFSKEQKEKMLCFAEKAEWRIQKLDESVVQKFCQEIGIKRRILKVWMHNNKNTFAKRNLSTS